MKKTMIHISSIILAGIMAAVTPSCMADQPSFAVDYEEPDDSGETGPQEELRTDFVSYYIDSVNGSDINDGTSRDKAWKSLSKAKSLNLLPGDQVLLKRGCTFNETLQVSNALGTASQPVTIAAFGSGDKPKIVAPDGSQYAVQIKNCSYITIENLDVSNHGSDPEMWDRVGFNVHLDNYGIAHNTVIRGIDIHDVNGRLWKGEGAGVALRFTMTKTRINYWDGITVEGCTIRDCSRNGIGFQGNHGRDAWYPHKRVVIRENLIERVPGDGIVVGECDGALVEYNVVRDCTDPWGDNHNASAGIWPWSSDNTVIQFNESSGQTTTWDAQGYDADYNCQNTTIRYNYSHDNKGGFILICNDGNAMNSYSIGNKGTRVYGNVSYNDGTRTEKRAKDKIWFSPSIHVSGPVEDCLVYHNILYVCKRTVKDQDKRFYYGNSWYGEPKSVSLENNVFYSENTDSAFERSGKGGDVLNNNWYMGINSASLISAGDQNARGTNAAFQKILDGASSPKQAITDAFLITKKTATATITTVDKTKIDIFFN